MNQAQADELISEVKRRSAIDPEFRTLAIKDASAAIAKISRSGIPSGVMVRFVDNMGPVQTVVLPDSLVDIEELSDVELEQVAGGDVSGSVTWRR